MTATVCFNGSLYRGEVLRRTAKRVLVRFTTGTDRTRDKWFTLVEKPAGVLISRRAPTPPRGTTAATIPPNSAFLEGP